MGGTFGTIVVIVVILVIGTIVETIGTCLIFANWF